MRVDNPGRIVIGASIILCCLLTRPLFAATQAVVVLVTSNETKTNTTAQRLEAELQSMDVKVLRVTASREETSIRKELQRVARERGAFAAVRIVSDGAEAEVWVADRVTGKTLVREVISKKDEGAFDDAVSLGAVELLRASLLEVSLDTPSKGEVLPSEVTPELLPKPHSVVRHTNNATAASRAPTEQLWVAFEPTVRFGVGALSSGSGFDVDVRLLSDSGFGGELLTHLAGSGQTVERPAGRVTLRSQQISLMGCYAPTFGRFGLSLALGVGASYIIATGEATAPNQAREQRRTSLSALGRTGLSFRVFPSIGIRMDLATGYAIPPLEVRMLGRKVSGYDHPFVFLGAGVEFRLPLEPVN